MDIKCIEQDIGEDHAIYCGDCIEIMEALPDQSVGLSIFSPPFNDLYVYSDSDRDLGNCRGIDEFFTMFGMVADQLRRLMMPGRIVAVHCMDLPSSAQNDGVIGLKDFPGDIVRLFQSKGFIYHSRVVIWKDPLVAATRTKALGLLHKQLCKDSTMSRMGIPDYVMAFRTPGENPSPVAHPEGLTQYVGSDDPGGVGEKRSHHIWRAYASPIWMDIRQTRTLNFRSARDNGDEKHICPLQLDVIERALVLWSNPGEAVLTPFMGVGSEVYGAVINGRRGIGIELKPSYYRQAVKNLAEAQRREAIELFDAAM